jgi:hypothetical protein
MKKLILLSLFLLSLGSTAVAQYGYYGNGGYYGRGRSLVPQAESPEKKPEPKTAEEIVAEEMPGIIEAAELNDFEAAVVRSSLTQYVQQRIELEILKMSPEDTREALEKINLAHRQELEAGLPPEKYQAMVQLQENNYNTKKLEKEKRKKKKKKT